MKMDDMIEKLKEMKKDGLDEVFICRDKVWTYEPKIFIKRVSKRRNLVVSRQGFMAVTIE